MNEDDVNARDYENPVLKRQATILRLFAAAAAAGGVYAFTRHRPGLGVAGLVVGGLAGIISVAHP